MSRIAFIGLGVMGGPMARHLVAAGHGVVGYNRSRRPVELLLEAGGAGAGSIAEAVADADVVISMVPDSASVETVALGAGGIFEHARPGTLYIDCSSIHPEVAAAVAAQGEREGILVVDAPVSGGETGAINATLSIMVGGREQAVTAAMPILKAFGKTVVHVGASGAGQMVKAANQLIVAGTIQLVAEAIVFLEAHDVDLPAAIRALAGGLAGNQILELKAAGMLRRDFAPGARIDLHHKDMAIVTAAAREAGVAIPLGALTAQLLGAVQAQGHGSLDHSALLLLVERWSSAENHNTKPGHYGTDTASISPSATAASTSARTPSSGATSSAGRS
jgi:2-hydroxy-3-oxopropionate reductase